MEPGAVGSSGMGAVGMVEDFSSSQFATHFLMILLNHMLLFAGSSYFFSKQLYRDYDVSRSSVKFVFAITCTAAISVLLLPLLELLHLGSPLLRATVWQFDIFLLIALTYLIIPSAFVHAVCLTLNTSHILLVDTIGIVLLVPALWIIFQKFGGSLQGIPVDSFSMEHLLARMAMCGVFVLSTLTGFGSIHYPYQSIRAFVNPVTSSQVAELELRLLHTISLIADKMRRVSSIQFDNSLPPYDIQTKQQLIQVVHTTSQGGAPAHSRSGGALGAAAGRVSSGRLETESHELLNDPRTVRGATGGDPAMQSHLLRAHAQYTKQSQGVYNYSGLEVTAGGESESDSRRGMLRGVGGGVWRLVRWGVREVMGLLASRVVESDELQRVQKAAREECRVVKGEIVALQSLSQELFLGLHEAAESRLCSLRSHTCMGRLNNFIGWFMTVVCVYRVFISMFNVSTRRVVHTDPATVLLTFAFERMKIPVDVTFWSPYVSLLLMGIIIALNIRGFLERILTVFRYMSTSLSSNLFALIISETLALYFAACALLMRIYLPETYREVVTDALGPSLNYDEFHLHFDLIFAISCCFSLILIVFTHTHKFNKFKTT